MNKREVGTQYEYRAADFLRKHGYEIIHRNFRCRIGEIDLIAKSEGYLCFIEVKYRSNTYHGFPAEAVNIRKIMKIHRTAQYYMLINQIPQHTPCRFDVVVILNGEFTLLKNAFEGV
ncbi:YraN family protein [Mobilitalea sibirica]|uniref:UPF0102 protein I5677_16020 n=1 Tax=Mobilitalea sibirica TaxID=1462919 RepID=A0A8J7HCJ6_9FIRM|nr:YraN family protein [Mobilitalea sibirica]MBH1942410.1 YraN family protein [Mobilitalea sibirica]